MNPKYDVMPNTWDQQNRLVKALLGTHESDYFYDGESRRVRIKELESGTQTKDETFVWCGARICQKRSASTVERSYFKEGFRDGTNSYFYTRDHLRSVREVVGADGTSILSRLAYDPWGMLSVSGTLTPDIGFSGHYFDRPSGAVLAPYRGYAPQLGRWLSPDPTGLRGGANLYGYVSNNPINLFDPTGYAEEHMDDPLCIVLYLAVVAVCINYGGSLTECDDIATFAYAKCIHREPPDRPNLNREPNACYSQ